MCLAAPSLHYISGYTDLIVHGCYCIGVFKQVLHVTPVRSHHRYIFYVEILLYECTYLQSDIILLQLEAEALESYTKQFRYSIEHVLSFYKKVRQLQCYAVKSLVWPIHISIHVYIQCVPVVGYNRQTTISRQNS